MGPPRRRFALEGGVGLVGVWGEQRHAGFLGSNGQLLAICPPHQRRAELVSWSPGFTAFKIRIITEFFQNGVISTPATERLKSSVRKVRPYSPRWRRWSSANPSGHWLVKMPAFLMDAVMPLSSNGLQEVSSWWWWRSLIAFRVPWSC